MQSAKTKVRMLARPVFLARNISVSSARLFSTTKADVGNYYKQQGNKQEQNEGLPADWDTALGYDQIPGPKPMPIFGNTLRFIFGEFKNMDFKKLNDLFYERHGKIAALRALPGMRDMVLLYDVKDIEKLFRNEGIWPYRVLMPSIGEYRTKYRQDIFSDAPGILTVHGEEWYNTRTKVNPILMQPRTIQKYTESIDEVTTDFINIVKKLIVKDKNNEMPEDFEFSIQKWALEAISNVALHRRLGCLSDNPKPETKRLVEAIARLFPALMQLDYQPSGFIHKKFNLKLWKDFIADMDFITYTIKGYIDESLQEAKKNQLSTSSEDKGVLEQLLEADAKMAITMTIDMIMAGVDTTTKATGTLLYLVTKNKEAQTKLREELVSLMPTPDSPVTEEVLSKAHYLSACIKEAMRMAPVTLGTIRTTTKEMVFGGYQVPKGVDVGTITSLTSMTTEHYVRPTEFLPERWLRTTTNELSHKNVNAFVTLPFGFGPRSCVGKRLANLEMQVMLAKMVRSFVLEWPHKDMKFLTTLTHGIGEPLKLRVTPVTK